MALGWISKQIVPSTPWTLPPNPSKGFEPLSQPADEFVPNLPEWKPTREKDFDFSKKMPNLVVIDTFTPEPGMIGPYSPPPAKTHGEKTEDSAKAQKGGLEILRDDLQKDPFLAVRGRPEAYGKMVLSGKLDPKALRNFPSKQYVARGAKLLEEVSLKLDRLKSSNLKNAAVNLSLGLSAANGHKDVMDTLDFALETHHKQTSNTGTSLNERAQALTYGIETPQDAARLIDTLAKTYGVEAKALKSADPKVSWAARQQLLQQVVDDLAGADKNPDLVKAKERYSKAVTDLEANHNSVVVAAGNEGEADKRLGPLKYPSNFYRSVLADAPGVTVVGAMDDEKKIAAYSNPAPEVSLYALGKSPADEFGAQSEGTSFASPRVAAEMAALHQKFPTLSSAEIEKKLKEQLTFQLKNYGAQPERPVLNFVR